MLKQVPIWGTFRIPLLIRCNSQTVENKRPPSQFSLTEQQGLNAVEPDTLPGGIGGVYSMLSLCRSIHQRFSGHSFCSCLRCKEIEEWSTWGENEVTLPVVWCMVLCALSTQPLGACDCAALVSSWLPSLHCTHSAVTAYMIFFFRKHSARPPILLHVNALSYRHCWSCFHY